MNISRLTVTSLVFTCLGVLCGAGITACLPYQSQVPFWVLILLGVGSAAFPVIAVTIQKVQPIQLNSDGRVKDNNLINNK